MVTKKTIFKILLTLLLISGIFYFGANQNSLAYLPEIASSSPEKIELEYRFLEPEIKKIDKEYYSIKLEGGNKFSAEPGLPLLPIKTARILIPQDREVKNINIIPGKKITLEGKFKIEYAKLPVPISQFKLAKTKLTSLVETEPNIEVYNSSKPFPDKLHFEVSTQYFRGYKILILNLFPVQYIPVPGKVFYYPNMRVIITTVPAELPPVSKTSFRNLSKDMSEVKIMIDNPSLINTYTEETIGTTETTEITPLSLTGGPFEYVIITNEALKDTFQTLANWKNSRGITTTVTTTEWIYANYDGTRPDGGMDNQTKIRNFIIDAYTNWQTEYVLLGGDGDGGGGAIIPHRGVYGQVQTGAAPPTYEIDEDIPCDLYYGALDGNWDTDKDGVYGEIEKQGQTVVDEADLSAEVYVGRIAADTTTEAENQINKIIAYENSIHSRNALLVGEQLDTYPTYGGNYKDEVYTYFPADWSSATLYQKDGTFSKAAVIDAMNSGRDHIVNHMGHANNTYDIGLNNPDVDGLTNTTYFLAYSQGCYANAFDNRDGGGNYISEDAISEHFTAENDKAAFAFVGNSRYGWYASGSTNGPSQQFDKEFFDAIFNENIINIGKTLQDSKEDLVGQVGAYGADRWCYFTLNLLGDPETSISWSDDVTPPTGTPTTPTDQGDYSYSFTITFDWTQGTAYDSETGIAGYYLQVGTTAGGNDKFDSDVGNVFSFDISGCETGKTYYARVRARNGVGLYGDYSGNSDGITIASPDLTVSSTDITFSNDNPNPDETITISATIHNIGMEYKDLFEHYDDVNDGASQDANYICDSSESEAQSFKLDADAQLVKISLYSADIGTLGDSITVDLRKDDGTGVPDSSAAGLIESTSATGSSSLYWQDFTFTSSLKAGTTYWLWAYNSELSQNGWVWTTDNTSPTYVDGYNAWTSDGGTTWNKDVGMDCWFRVYGKKTKVQFYNGDPDTSGTLISTNYPSSIPGLASTTALVEWSATSSGVYDIYVVIDPDNKITELNETNNKAYKSISVGEGIITLTKSFQDGVYPTSTYSGTRDTELKIFSPDEWEGDDLDFAIDGIDVNEERNALVKWDISAIPSGSIVTSASITLTTDTNASDETFPIYECLKDWVEATATATIYDKDKYWGTLGAKNITDDPDRGTTVLGYVYGSVKDTTYTFNLNSDGVSLVQSWVDFPGANYGITIQKATATNAIHYRSRDSDTANLRPKLTVSYTEGKVLKLFGFPANLWQMISVPLQPENPDPEAILSDDLGNIFYNWTLARWQPFEGVYKYHKAVCCPWAASSTSILPDFSPGLGYWLNARLGPTDIDVSGDLTLDNDYSIHLSPGTSTEIGGWNQIGVPFNYSVDWSSSTIKVKNTQTQETVDIETAQANNWVENKIWWQDGTSTSYSFAISPEGQLNPWAGYWVHNFIECDLIVSPTPIQGAGGQSASIDMLQEIQSDFSEKTEKQAGKSQQKWQDYLPEWKLQLLISADSEKDTYNFAGISPAAKDDYDALDVLEPPPISKGINLYFPHQDFAFNPGNYTQDIKGSDFKNKEWNFEIKSELQQTAITLSWLGLEQIEYYDLSLIDLDANQTIDIYNTTNYTFELEKGGIRHFELTAKVKPGKGKLFKE